MRFTIFSRLIIGYLIIFILAAAVTVYAVIKLRQFNNVARRIISVDNQILDYQKKLADSTLSQVRYQKKYVITKDIALYNQFLSAKHDFDQFLGTALSIADTAQKIETLSRIQAHQARYMTIVAEEVASVQAEQRYSKRWYEQEEEKATDGIFAELKNLETYNRQDIVEKMRRLGEAGRASRNVAVGMGISALILIVATTIFITRSITKPLRLLMAKTQEVSDGVFKEDLTISSPPEMAALTKAFNSMCGRLKVVDKMKSDFFAMMSHELRTPLTSIKEGTALLQEGIAGTITDKQKRLLSIIAAESRRLIELVNSLLDLSKMEGGMMTYSFEKGAVVPLIERVMVEMVPLFEAKKISLSKAVEDQLPLVKIDRERILQVLRNLLGNAVKFTPDQGQVRISARPIDRGVEVSVSDTGPGIRPEDLDTIFNKFQQVAPTGSYKIKGTGLGLAIAKHIITSHGGKIWAESNPAKGSTFLFVLPA
jgi:two-component system, NtrC family, sensor histidine kinase GlrK